MLQSAPKSVSANADQKFAALALIDLQRLKVFSNQQFLPRGFNLSLDIIKAVSSDNKREIERIGLDRVGTFCQKMRDWQGLIYLPALEGNYITSVQMQRKDLESILIMLGYEVSGPSQVRLLTKSLSSFRVSDPKTIAEHIDPVRVQMEMDCSLKIMLGINDEPRSAAEKMAIRRASSLAEAFRKLKNEIEICCA